MQNGKKLLTSSEINILLKNGKKKKKKKSPEFSFNELLYKKTNF